MITLNDITLLRGAKTLFANATFSIYAKQKVGIIGLNGSGKSSLIALILDKLHADHGKINIQNGVRISHLEQEIPTGKISALNYVLSGDHGYCQLQQQIQTAENNNQHEKLVKLHDQMHDIDGYSRPATAARLLHGLGFEQASHHQSVNEFSGGWRMRLNLAKALISPADLLLLDEPTNHLDLDAIIWLEKWLQNINIAILLISHDRDFLDNTINHVLHIHQQKMILYTGNYSSFEEQYAKNLVLQQAIYEKQQKHVAKTMDFVNRFRAKATKAKQAQSRLKALDRIEFVSAIQAESQFNINFIQPTRLPNPLLQIHHAKVKYGDKLILQDINFSITAQARIGLLGPNGAGKSSLLKLLTASDQLDSNVLEISKGTKLCYFAQHQIETLNLANSPLQHLQQLAETGRTQDFRDFLGRFAFPADKALTPVKLFSGGEKARLALALLIWQKPNLLLLDEPTNHLDMEMRNALSLALQEYSGAMIVVSHDRFLLRSNCNEFWLVANQQVKKFSGDLDDYYQWLLEQKKSTAANKISKKSKTEATNNHKEFQKKLSRIEKELEKKNKQLMTLETKLANPKLYADTDSTELPDLQRQYKALKTDVEQLEATWLDLQT